MWTDFFAAAATASAALAGLVFVALSVNIGRIIQFSHLPARAGAAMATLILILVSSMVMLVHQDILPLGIEILAFTVCCGWLVIKSIRLSWKAQAVHQRPGREWKIETAVGFVELVPFLAGAVLLIANNAAGFYAVAAGVILVFIFAVMNAWVLLVEILR